MIAKLQCGLVVSVVETGPGHKSHPNEWFWQVDAGGHAPCGQGYADNKQAAILAARQSTFTVLANSERELSRAIGGAP